MFLVVTRTLRGTPDAVHGGLADLRRRSSSASSRRRLLWTPIAQLAGRRCCWRCSASWRCSAIVCVNRSLALAPASVVVPYQYTMIVWAVIFGYLFFGDVPTLQTLVGAAIIVGAGLFIFFREQKVGLPAAEEIAPER